MSDQHESDAHAGASGARALPSAAARLVHAQIVAAAGDLERLLQVLDQAGNDLMLRFGEFDRLVERININARGTPVAAHGEALKTELLGATTAMQFQDMSTQLVNHALRELRTLAERLGDNTDFHDTPEGPALVRPGPVSQSGIGAGSIDLF